MDAENLLAKASDNLSVRRAFGAAYEKDGTLIIPVAVVAGGGGGGTSPGRSGKPEQDGAPQDDPGRVDAGGGFGGLVLPSGAYVVKGDQVRWVPAVNPALVILASLSLARRLTSAWVRRSGNQARR